MENYYAIQVVPGHEQRVKKLFIKCYNSFSLTEKIDLLIPQHLVHRKMKHRYKNIWIPQWPGYIILKCPHLNHELYYMLKRLSGVIRIFENNIPIEQLNCSFGSNCSQFKRRLEIAKRLLQRNNSFSRIFCKNLKRLKVVGCIFRYQWKWVPTNRSAPLLN